MQLAPTLTQLAKCKFSWDGRGDSFLDEEESTWNGGNGIWYKYQSIFECPPTFSAFLS